MLLFDFKMGIWSEFKPLELTAESASDSLKWHVSDVGRYVSPSGTHGLVLNGDLEYYSVSFDFVLEAEKECCLVVL